MFHVCNYTWICCGWSCVSREKMADPYRETVVQEVQNGFVPYLRDTILPDRAKQRNDTRLSTSPRPRISFFSVRVNINLHSAGHVGVTVCHHAVCNMMIARRFFVLSVGTWINMMIEMIEIIERESSSFNWRRKIVALWKNVDLIISSTRFDAWKTR